MNLKAILAALVTMFFLPFNELAQELIDVLIDVLTMSVQIHPNPVVELIHKLTLGVAVLASTLVVVASGFYHIAGREYGWSYEAIGGILPRLVIGLGFAVVALPVLQFGLDFANAFVEVFRPEGSVNLEQLTGLSAGLLLVWLVNAWLLLALVVLFVLRYVYLVFISAVSPLIAVGWALPNTRPYANSFISVWFVLLAVAPADVLVLRFALAMLEGSGETGIQALSNWILGTASFSLMLYIPYQLLSVSQGLVGGRNIVSGIRSSWRGTRPIGGGSAGGSEVSDQEFRRQRREQRRRDRDRGGRW